MCPQNLRLILVLLATVLVPGAQAQLPLSISDLLVPEGSWKWSNRFGYSQVQRPLALGAGVRGQQSFEVAGLASRLRWGPTRDVELNLQLNHEQLDSELWPVEKQSESRSSLASGFTWQVNPEARWPAVLLFGDLRLASSEFGDSADYDYVREGTLGFTTYRSIDPVVLSLSAAFTRRLGRDINAEKHVPGDVWTLQPQVNFAVNHRLSLVGGISARLQQAGRIDGRMFGPRETQLSTVLGLGLKLGPRATLFANSEFTTVGDDALSLSAEWVYRF